MIMYKCDSMANTCGDCISMDTQYKCGWCDDACTINSQCTKVAWLPSTATCPNVEITSVSLHFGDNESLFVIFCSDCLQM